MLEVLGGIFLFLLLIFAWSLAWGVVFSVIRWIFGLFKSLLSTNSLEQLITKAELGNAKAQHALGFSYAEGHIVEKNYVLAKKWFEKAAQQGYVESQYALGLLCGSSKGNSNIKEGIFWMKEAAKHGHPEAKKWCEKLLTGKGLREAVLKELKKQEKTEKQFGIGEVYFADDDVKQGQTDTLIKNTKPNYLEKKETLEKAAERGEAEAQFDLGSLYAQGEGVKQDYKKAKELYEKAANQGYAQAQYNLGGFYQEGLGGEQNYTKTKQWWEKSAKQGYVYAQFNLGYAYADGLGGEKDYAKAKKWFEKAAQQGFSEAQFELGFLYANGYGVKKNYEKALEWWNKSAKQGNSRAQTMLRDINNLKEKTEKPNYSEEKEILEKAAERGDAEAQFKLGNLYMQGKGVEQSREKAIFWLEKSAEQDFPPAKIVYQILKNMVTEHVEKIKIETLRKEAKQGQANSQWLLGGAYNNGLMGIEKDHKKAKYWYEKAALQGHADAQSSLGYLYVYGRGVPQDFKLARQWLEKAAQQGEADAQGIIAGFYAGGHGDVKQDMTKAFYWGEKAAKQGNPPAQFLLGMLYQNGDIVSQDCVLSHVWFSIAADNGLQESHDILRPIANELSPEEIEKAKKLKNRMIKENPKLIKKNHS